MALRDTMSVIEVLPEIATGKVVIEPWLLVFLGHSHWLPFA